MSTEVLDQLEGRSVQEDRVKDPELSTEQKNQLLLVQRQILSLKVNINEQTKQLEQLAPAFNNLVTRMANELKVDGSKFTFDIDTLSFVPKK